LQDFKDYFFSKPSKEDLMKLIFATGMKYDRSLVVEQRPDIDYRKLDDPAFAQSEEGQRLQRSYARSLGPKIVKDYFRLLIIITAEGKKIPKPQIPLAEQPVFEAIIENEILRNRWEDIIYVIDEIIPIAAYSDSQRVHKALLLLLTERFTEEARKQPSFRGEREFDHKAKIANWLLGAYTDYYEDDSKRALLIDDLNKVLDAYTGKGKMLATVEQEEDEFWKRIDLWNVKGIAARLLTVFLAAPDDELAQRAAAIIENEVDAAETATTHSRSELMQICFNALGYINERTDLETYAKAVGTVFEGTEFGERLMELARERQELERLENQPQILKIRDKRRNEEEIDIKEQEALREINDKSDKYYCDKNQFLFEFIEYAMQNPEKFSLSTADFTYLIKKIDFPTHGIRELPAEYHRLMKIARLPNITAEQRNAIVRRIADKFKGADPKNRDLCVRVVLDIYELFMGPADGVERLDNSVLNEFTLSGLEAAIWLVRADPFIFKSADLEQLKQLDTYVQAIKRIMNKIRNNPMRRHELSKLESLVWGHKDVERCYIRQVTRADPKRYYSWFLEQLSPLLQRIQLVLESSDSPNREISDLYQTLQKYVGVREKSVSEYSEDFDPLKYDNFDELLLKLYEQLFSNDNVKRELFVPEDLWRDDNLGSFKIEVVDNMPLDLLKSIIDKYRGTPFAKWLEMESRELRRI
jgi:hypothetical protein